MFHLSLILLYLIIPLICCLKNWHKFLIFWIIQGMFLDIFAVSFHGNISAFRIAGIVVLPFALFRSIDLIKTLLAKLLMVQGAWLLATFIFFVYVSPWENTTQYPLFQSSYLPAAKQLLNFVSEFSLILYLGDQLKTKEKLEWSLKSLFISGLICLAGIFLEKIFKVDFYHFFTNGKQLLLEDRVRGFTYEPRVASQYMVYLLIFMLTVSSIGTLKKVMLIPFVVVAFLLSKSLSGFMILALGIPVMMVTMFQIHHRYRRQTISLLVLLLTSTGIALITPISTPLKIYLRDKYVQQNREPLFQKLEYADGAAATFLINNPLYLTVGVGTGQASLASTPFAAEKYKIQFPRGINYLPAMGIIAGFMNGGFVLLLLQLSFISIGLKSVLILVRKTNIDVYKDVYVLSAVFSLLYFLQIRFFHVYALAIMLMAFNLIKGSESPSKK